MRIQEQIKQELRASMVGGNKELTSLLRVVLGEFSREGKELSDEQALKVIKKMRDNAVELKNEFEEIELNRYLPSMLELKELREMIKYIIEVNELSGMQNMGRVMGELSKSKENSRIDKSTASQIVRELLS